MGGAYIMGGGLDEAVSAIGWSVKVVEMVSITCETVSTLTSSDC